MYPQELLPRRNAPIPATDDFSMFVRMLKEFPYDCIDEDEFLPEITDAILSPNGDLEIYSLSLYIYGTYNESHFNIVVTDKEYFSSWDGEEELTDIPFEEQERFAIFLKTNALKDKSVLYKNNKGGNDVYYLHYEHKPTRSNFWHFELFVTKNDETMHVPRKSGATRKNVAEKIKEDILYFAAKDVKDEFFELYNGLLRHN